MRYIYVVTHDADYEGYDIVAVKTNRRDAFEYAESNLGGDTTYVLRYPDSWEGSAYHSAKFIIAKWRRKGFGAQPKFERKI